MLNYQLNRIIIIIIIIVLCVCACVPVLKNELQKVIQYRKTSKRKTGSQHGKFFKDLKVKVFLSSFWCWDTIFLCCYKVLGSNGCKTKQIIKISGFVRKHKCWRWRKCRCPRHDSKHGAECANNYEKKAPIQIQKCETTFLIYSFLSVF